jgi:hypothetical protein
VVAVYCQVEVSGLLICWGILVVYRHSFISLTSFLHKKNAPASRARMVSAVTVLIAAFALVDIPEDDGT